jgi:hypothetical protein
MEPQIIISDGSESREKFRINFLVMMKEIYLK